MAKTDPARDATVADVAARAGVSKAQAARALGSYGAVSDAVRANVLSAAQELGYRTNHLARSMNTGRSQTVGVVVGDIENPYFGRVVRGISDTARHRGYNVMLLNTDERLDAEVDAVRVLLDMRVDGLIVAPCSADHTEHLLEVADRGKALVLFDRDAPGLDVDVVAVDFRPASRSATEQLLAAGHSRIAYVSSLRFPGGYTPGADLGTSPVVQRIGGMEDALAAHGHALDADLVRLNATTPDAVATAVAELLRLPDPPTAFVASDSLIAQEVLGTLQGLGLRIPHNASFVMYDDFPWTRLTTPPLTVIGQPVHEMGVEAARRLLDRIDGIDPGPMPQMSARVVQRGSIGAPPACVAEQVAKLTAASTWIAECQ